MTHLVQAAGLLAVAALLATPALGEHRKAVDGVVINIGVVPAARMLQTDAYERAAHGQSTANATHHVVVGVVDAKTGTPIGDARVTLDLTDPHGGTQSRRLAVGDPGGFPDYSGLFRFGWSGEYRMQVKVERAEAAPARATFGWKQDAY